MLVSTLASLATCPSFASLRHAIQGATALQHPKEVKSKPTSFSTVHAMAVEMDEIQGIVSAESPCFIFAVRPGQLDLLHNLLQIPWRVCNRDSMADINSMQWDALNISKVLKHLRWQLMMGAGLDDNMTMSASEEH